MVIAMCSKAQNLNFANNNNYEMLYFTDEDDEDYTISKYDIKVNLNKNFFGDLSFKWCKINKTKEYVNIITKDNGGRCSK